MSMAAFTITTIAAPIVTLLISPSNLYLNHNNPSNFIIALSSDIIKAYAWRFGVFSLYLLVISRIAITFDDSN